MYFRNIGKMIQLNDDGYIIHTPTGCSTITVLDQLNGGSISVVVEISQEKKYNKKSKILNI